MEQYMKEVLEERYICPSTSPASARVFFIKKKHGGLRPCVDYRGLNKLLVQYLFQFRVTYRPGEKNTQAEVLFRQHNAEALLTSSEPVLSPSCFLASLEWELDRRIKAANLHPQCPPNHLYVPAKYLGALITWAHTSLGTGHPGTSRTAQLIGVLLVAGVCPQ
ncbi:hypothetical protein P4O66_004686 [Electrophorus voltai]|uniref:Reverse transcriptase RNase H-like domain-containing protein n=1 Tax=Electrophorus voltai TaxID=2609070 RepID=A0AAD8ZKY4_9TELE|nr:hypothetical protein P4O66_004686 [Electrophorus voltai]